MKTKSNILIVEDDTALNEAYVTILNGAGYEVAAAFNGEEALAYIEQKGDPDLILLDLRMPVMDGIGFLERYNSPSHPKTSIILFSNYEAQKEVNEAFKLGVERYILKSLASPRELLRMVETTLNEKR
jgi:two-component system response regulator YesN